MPISSPLTSPVTFHSFAALESFQILISWHGLFSLYWGCSHTQVAKQNAFQVGWEKGKKKRGKIKEHDTQIYPPVLGSGHHARVQRWRDAFSVSQIRTCGTQGEEQGWSHPHWLLSCSVPRPAGAGSTADPTHFAKWAFSAVVPRVLYRSTLSHTSKCSYS